MDLNYKDEQKLKKILSKTVKKIRKNRKNFKLIKELQQFQEIKQLLNSSEGDEECKELKQEEKEESEDVTLTESLSSCTIPFSACGIEVFQEKNTFWLFDEGTLCLKDFLKENETCNVFGNDDLVPNEDLFRDLIAHHITESILPDNEKCNSISLYVLYLMSVHTNKEFVCACLDFLKYRRFKISAADILPIFINFGSSSRVLIGSDFSVELPRNISRSADRKAAGDDFPYYNVEMVADLILHYTHFGLIKNEPEVKLLLIALTRLSLDWKIRYSRLFSIYSTLLSVLSSEFVDVFDVNEVVSCLHLKEEHIMNQVEVARVLLMPVSSALHQTLINETINFILKLNILKSHTLKVQDVINILHELQRKKLTPLEIYCILQLMNGSLPIVTARGKQIGDINSALLSLEAGFFKVEDSIDLIRLKLEVAKLRNLVTNNADKIFSTCYANPSLEETRE